MRRKQLWKALGAGMLALSLFISPLAGANAKAAEIEEGSGSTPAAGSVKDINPARVEEIPAVGTEGEEGYVPAIPAYEDVKIPVYGFTDDAKVYSVDVEWGAMTFQWESSLWDPKTHMKKQSSGWKVYDDANSKALDATEDLINEIKVTNHSNAGVWATLSYTSEADYTATMGGFAFEQGTDAGDENKLTPADDGNNVPAYLTLESADNNLGDGEGVGKATVGKAYFMPNDLGAGQILEKWTQIGTITVGIKTEQPTAAEAP